MLESSLYMDKNVKKILNDYAFSTGVSTTYIIKHLLKMLNSRYSYTPTVPGLIKYQKKQEKENWKIIRYKLTQEEKELFEEMRIKFKISISFLVLIAFLLFFKKLKQSKDIIKNSITCSMYSYTLLPKI
ncbi:MAG: hypothetical protein JW982_09285, partial [Spirochaetes bacterium]|nr:hypothetical protein [Spirochaetota bacterium]